MSLEGKIVLVTGAAKRVGRGIALRLAEEGARVAIHYHRSEEEARRTADECRAELFRANLESVAEIEKMFAEIEQRMGQLDGLVNNAARFTRFDPLEITEKDWDFIHSVNLKAMFFSCQNGARLMLKSGGGRIVNLSSLGGIRPWAEHAHYCSSKAGVIMLTRALAKAFAPHITVNSVAFKKYTTASAISAGVPPRPAGVASISFFPRSSISSNGITPGATELTVIRGAHALASARVSMMTPAFDAQ